MLAGHSMSEPVNANSESGEATAGALLRRARESAGLHVAALAVMLKVPVRKLEAMEADRIDQLGDAVFVRALASSICRTLKVDPQPVLERLPANAVPRLGTHQDGINAPFRSPSDGPAPTWLDQLSRPTTLAVLAILVAALVIALLPDIRRESEASSSRVVSESVIAASSGGQAASVATPVIANPSAPTAAPGEPGGAQAVALTPSVSTPSVPSPTMTVTPAENAPDGGGGRTGLLSIRTVGLSWVEVADAQGEVVYRRQMTAGESASVSGRTPLTVVVGRADLTEVSVRGKRLDLAPMTRDNVARFEVR